MDHSSLPLDVQCRAAEQELGQRVHVDRLLLARSPLNSLSQVPRTGLPNQLHSLLDVRHALLEAATNRAVRR